MTKLIALSFPLLFLLSCSSSRPHFSRIASHLPDQNVFKNVAAETLRGNVSETTSRRIDELLKKGLTPNDAVTIALLNNRELQAKFARIGLTQAQIQGSMPENPAAGTTLIVDGHESLSYEAHFSHNLASILHATRQRATLRHQLDAEHKLAATEVMSLAHARS